MSRSQIIIDRLLSIRGIDAADREFFLNPTLKYLADPAKLDGIVQAAETVLEAVEARRRIVVFGDYDCDGICATAILMRIFGALGADAAAFIPDRLKEGYGMKESSIARMFAENPGVGLVVTVDNGVGSINEVAALKARGVSVVVTDHHLPGSDDEGRMKLPAADALVNPKVSSPPGMEGLCGAGVAFLLANRIMSEARRRGMYDGPSVGGPLLVLAGLSSVTDIMPLTGQNRVFVSESLSRFFSCAPLGLKELYARCARSGASRLTSRDFGFMLGPRINAAGRMASGMDALELLLCEDREVARELAREVDVHNLERKSVEQRMTEAAMAGIVEGAPAQVIELKDGHPGVVGIVAARVLERLEKKVPVCVAADGRGSARSPDEVNVYDAFVYCSEFLEAFGGHAVAGGFTVKAGKIGEFRERLCEYCARLEAVTDKESSADADVDMWIEEGDVTLELAEAVLRLEPFGEANPEPLFGIKGVYLSDVRLLGADGRHLSMALRGSGVRGVLWNKGEMVESLLRHGASRYDVVFSLTVSEYGERHVELRIVRLTRQPPEGA